MNAVEEKFQDSTRRGSTHSLVSRFVNDITGPSSADFQSPRARLTQKDLDSYMANGRTISSEIQRLGKLELRVVAELTAQGSIPLISPMVAVLEDPHYAWGAVHRENGDKWLRSIMMESRYIAILNVPNNRIFVPQSYLTETELMVLSRNVWRYLHKINKNPFRT